MVPIETSPEWDARHQGQDVPRLKQLTHAMIARARLAECEGQTETAFEAYKEAFCFADAIGRGGLSLDFLNSIACRALVLRHCQSLLPELAADQRAEFLRLIQRSAAEQETAAAVAKRTRQWQRATFGLRGWLETWRSLVLETLQASSRSTLAAKKVFYEQQYEKVVCDRLRATDYLKQTNAEPDSPATGSQPIRSDTNVTLSAADSCR
jgi:hypothetical protein